MNYAIKISDNFLKAAAVCLVLSGCIESFEPQGVDFKSALVVEATITDQNKHQEIFITRTFPLDTTGIYGESDAQVQVLDSNGGVFEFEDKGQGRYESRNPFATEANVGYQLDILTKDGERFKSTEEIAPMPTKIDSIYAERDFKDGGAEEGIFVYVDSNQPNSPNTNYQFTFEETYKIIAPYWSPEEAYVISRVPFNYKVGKFLREQEERICYNTVPSVEIIQENTAQYEENKISKFPVRFLSRNNWILKHRYSILIKQVVQSSEAYSYYNSLASLSSASNSLYQIQTGFLEGNIYSESNGENIVGYFQVSSVDEKRIYFKYEDFFPGEEPLGYESDCELVTPLLNDIGGGSYLAYGIDEDLFTFYRWNEDYQGSNFNTPMIMAMPSSCGDCTHLGNNVPPDFWIEE